MPGTAAAREGERSIQREAEAIVVTGSRIEGHATPEPRFVLEGDVIRAQGHANIADALNALPGFRGSVTPDGVQESFGQGVNFVNALGLGSSRTLTLINGRRVVSSNVPTMFGQAEPGSQVDLNQIAAILVGKVERVSTGGAPVYGAEAIAGTVNVRLRNAMEGLELRTSGGLTQRGDNARSNFSAAYGTRIGGGRGHLVLALSRDRVRGVRQNARRFFRDNVLEAPNTGPAGEVGDGRLNPGIGPDTGPSDGNPSTVLIRDGTLPFLSEGGLVASGPLAFAHAFDSRGRLVPFDAGAAHGPVASGGDGMRLSDFGQITSRLARLSVHLLSEYALTDRLRLSAEAHFFRMRADELADQPAYNALLFSGASAPLLFDTSNPFLTPQARKLLEAGGNRSFLLSRAHADLGDPTGYATSRIARAVGALKGEFRLGGRPLAVEVSASFGRTDWTDHDQQIDQQKFINAINVTRGPDGRIRCDPASDRPTGGVPIPDPACRPLNLFGAGAPSRAALAYVLADVRARSRMSQLVLSAHAGGAPFALFGRRVALAIGIERRLEKGAFRPDAFQQGGLGRSVPVAPVKGGYGMDEAFAEVQVPALRSAHGALPGAVRLFARARIGRNSENGGFLAWSAGATVEPGSGWQMRGQFTRSFRAPAIAELYSPLSTAREMVPDLCSPANAATGPAPPVRSRNCAAFLRAFPRATPLTASLVAIPALSGGSRGLKNEKADSVTLGAVWTPPALPGLTLFADYIAVRVARPIAFLTAAQIASACFDNPDFDLADPAHGNRWCERIGRDRNGQVTADAAAPAVRTGFVNGKAMRFSGIEGGLSGTFDLAGAGLRGQIGLDGRLLCVLRRSRDLTGTGAERLDGLVGDPAFQAQLRTTFAVRGLGVGVTLRYTGAQLFGRTGRSPGPNDRREIDKLDAFATVDADLSVPVLEGASLGLAVTNLFDRRGQRYHGALIPQSINDPLGRRVSLSLTARL